MNDALILEAIVFAGLLFLLVFLAILVLAMRSRSLPVCVKCESPSIRPARPNKLDVIWRLCFLYPHRCDKCLSRYYCFRSGNPAAAGR
jgi:hypothetical protein